MHANIDRDAISFGMKNQIKHNASTARFPEGSPAGNCWMKPFATRIINLLRIQHERQRKTMFPSIGEYAS